MTFDREILRVLEVDGEKLRELTGREHGPWTYLFLFPDEDEYEEDLDDDEWDGYNYDEDYPNEDDLEMNKDEY